MIGLSALWLPILLSAVLVFVVSAVIHMMTPWHKADFKGVPNEDQFRSVLGPLDVPPGDYMVPHSGAGSAAMKDPEFLAKWDQGPNMIFTVVPKRMPSMTTSLVQWFVYLVLVGVFAGYIASRVLPRGAEYLEVFRFVGTTAFLGYAFALAQSSIWYQRAWSTTLKSMFDGLIYALLTAGVMGWLWPK